MTDAGLIEAFVKTRGVVVLPPGHARYTGITIPTARTRTRGAWQEKEPVPTGLEPLARAKLLTLLQDLCGKAHGATASAKLKLRNDAFHWFFGRDSDFELWCEMAALNPEIVRQHAKRFYENGLPQWRAKPGESARYEKRRAYRLRQKAAETT